MNEIGDIHRIPTQELLKGFSEVPGQDDPKLQNLAKAEMYLKLARKAEKQGKPIIAYEAAKAAVICAERAKKASGKGTPALSVRRMARETRTLSVRRVARGVGEIGGVWAERAREDRERYNAALVYHQKLAKYYDDLRKAYETAKNTYSKLVEQYNSLVKEVGNVRSQISTKLSEYQSLVAEYKNNLALLERAKRVYDAALIEYQKALNYVTSQLKEYKDQLMYYASKVKYLASKLGIDVGDIGEIGFTLPSLDDIKNRLQGYSEAAKQQFMSLYNKALSGYYAAKSAYENAKSRLNEYLSKFKSRVDSAGATLTSLANKVKSTLNAATEKANLVNRLKQSYNAAVNSANGVVSAVNKVKLQIKALVKKINDAATLLAKSAANLKNLAYTAANSAKKAYEEAVGEAKERAREAYEKAKNAAQSVETKIDEAKDAVSEAIKDSAEAIGEKAKNAAKMIRTFGEDRWEEIKSKLNEMGDHYVRTTKNVNLAMKDPNIPKRIKASILVRYAALQHMIAPLLLALKKIADRNVEEEIQGIGELATATVIAIAAVSLATIAIVIAYCKRLDADIEEARTGAGEEVIENYDEWLNKGVASYDEAIEECQKQVELADTEEAKKLQQEICEELRKSKTNFINENPPPDIAITDDGMYVGTNLPNAEDLGLDSDLFDPKREEGGIIPDFLKKFIPEIPDKTKAMIVLGGAGVLALMFLPQLLFAGKAIGGFTADQVKEASRVMRDEERPGLLSQGVKSRIKRR